MDRQVDEVALMLIGSKIEGGRKVESEDRVETGYEDEEHREIQWVGGLQARGL